MGLDGVQVSRRRRPARRRSGIPRAGTRSATRAISRTSDIRHIVKVMETVREELGPGCRLRGRDATGATTYADAIRLAKALEHVKPMWLEDPVPPKIRRRWRACGANRQFPSVQAKICTGSQGFREADRVAGHATACTSTFRSRADCSRRNASPIWRIELWHLDRGAQPSEPGGHDRFGARGIRDAQFPHPRTRELDRLVAGLVIHDGPIWENGYLTIQDKPGYGIEINPTWQKRT